MTHNKKKRSAATGRGDMKKLIQHVAKDDEITVSKAGMSTLLAVYRAETEALRDQTRGVVNELRLKTLSLDVAEAAVKMRYPGQAELLEAGQQATTRYESSSS